MIRFKATNEQVLQMAANASNASAPMGMGHMSFRPETTFKPDDFEMCPIGISVDYCQGRMVKFHADRVKGLWEMREPRYDYQSWIGTYPTARALIESAGGKVIEHSEVME